MRSSNLTPCVGIQTWGVKIDPGVTDLQSGVSAGKASGQTGQGLLCSHLLLQESQLLLAACDNKCSFPPNFTFFGLVLPTPFFFEHLLPSKAIHSPVIALQDLKGVICA